MPDKKKNKCYECRKPIEDNRIYCKKCQKKVEKRPPNRELRFKYPGET